MFYFINLFFILIFVKMNPQVDELFSNLVADEKLDRRHGRVQVRFDSLQELYLFLGRQEVDGALGGHHDRVRQLISEEPSLKI